MMLSVFTLLDNTKTFDPFNVNIIVITGYYNAYVLYRPDIYNYFIKIFLGRIRHCGAFRVTTGAAP